MLKHSAHQLSRLSAFIKYSLSVTLYSALFVLPVSAVEFNTDMIDVEDRSNIDISQFEKKATSRRVAISSAFRSIKTRCLNPQQWSGSQRKTKAVRKFV